MATKRKSSKKRKGHRRHRRVGALGLNASSPLVKLGAVAVGFLAADKFVNPAIDKVTGTMDDKIKAGAQVGLGGLLVLSRKTRNNLLAVGAGGVLAGAGLKRGLRVMGVINGYQNVPVIGKHGVNGYGKVPVIGYTPNQSLNGAGGGFMVPKPVGQQIMGSASGSGVTHNSSSFMD